MGQYHSLELSLQRNFTIQKSVWDALYLERLEAACDMARTAEMAGVIMREGAAQLCLIGPY